ncbi:hypothetical protein CCM_05204 [Cordyceps militaris CM01]|uniref:MFS maltose permease n=1 Tax=Cordyceps militaris (strain CM01) TaxID=983644 RepID=G3JIE6_CORMM|nr:uncharacterized protein CCM_05204 [Cordyceps militaris CM01]EGX91047.1 hypothetical protein CCM_05204 [Cordyceps militaris CM01]
MLAAGLVIFFFIQEEILEREHPTPHEWTYMTRKYLRDARQLEDPKDGNIRWASSLGRVRNALMRLSDPKKDGAGLVPLSDVTDPELEDPIEFVPYDITAKSEEWRRGYFEALMTAAKTAEHVDGWVLDVTRNMVSPARFVIGPSNPNPVPIPPGAAHAPLEENCVGAFPLADRWYMKILATKGFTERQRLEAALEYASFMEYKDQAEAARSLQELALGEATKGTDATRLPYDGKTFTVRDNTDPPSQNLLDVLGSIANSKARSGDISGALPMYISLLKARRGLSDERPHEPRRSRPSDVSVYQRVLDFVQPPAYPPPPPDGTRPPWRSAEERCQEASLQIYIGEILYASGSRDDGISWTRDGVDLAEEQLRALGAGTKGTKKLCRECLGTGLDNWRAMVSQLAKAERAKEEGAAASKPSMFSFWGGAKEPDGRWAAEEAVVQERVRRTKDIMEDVAPPRDFITNWFKA